MTSHALCSAAYTLGGLAAATGAAGFCPAYFLFHFDSLSESAKAGSLTRVAVPSQNS